MKKSLENNYGTESQERTRLRRLEDEDKWVFHGSPYKVEIFEPRQAYQYPKDKEPEPDGDPAVFASPCADIAIFMSIINKENAPLGYDSVFGTNEKGEVTFKATEKTIAQLHNVNGYVYVFDKTKFSPLSTIQSISHMPVAPDEIVVVSEKDLPIIKIEDF